MSLSGTGLAALLLDAALRGAVLLALAHGATALMRRASAAARHLVWSAALAAVVLLPLLGAVVPRWPVLPLPALAAPVAEPVLPRDAAVQEPAAFAPAEPAEPRAEAAGAPAVRERTELDWRALVLLVWLAGAALLALRLGYGVTRVWWLERRATEITDEEWVHAVDALARRLRVGRIVTLLRGPGATVPMTWGLVRPVVLLPEEADAWDGERRAAVLAHELAHVRRWDALTQWVAHLAMALFWFNPLVWVACRRAREEREHACDDAVLALGTQPTRYADHLLDIVRALGTAEGPAAALAMARRSQFEGRLLAILDRAAPRGGVSRRAVLATLAATAAVVLPLAAVGAAPARGGAAAEAEPPATAAETTSGATAAAQPPVEMGDLPRVPVPVYGSPAEAWTAEPRPAESPEVAAAWALGSDGDRARYLSALIEQLPDSGVYAEVARAAARMTSPADQRQVLVAVVTCVQVPRSGVVAAVESVPSIRSSSDQRVVLAEVAGRGWLRDAAVRRAYLRSLESISDSSDRRELLRMVLERGQTDPETLAGVITAAGRLGASSDARSVLMPAAATGRVTGPLRDLYVRTATALADESDRAAALTALLGTGAQGSTASPTLPSDVPDAGGWINRMVLTDGVLEYTDERGGETWQLRVEGKSFLVQSNGSASRVVTRPGGRVVLRETGPATRSLEIRADAAGRETRTFRVGGSPRPYDADAAAWTAAFLQRLHFHLHNGKSGGSAAAAPAGSARDDGRTQVWESENEVFHGHDERPASDVNIAAKRVQVRGGQVVGILPGGSLAVQEVLYPDYPDPDPLKPGPGATTTRRLEGRRAAGGGVRWTYRVDGVERPFEGEARAWFARVLRKHTSVR